MCRSDPQIPVDVTRMIASVPSWIDGSGTVSTRTSRLPCQATAFTVRAFPERAVANGAVSVDELAGHAGDRHAPQQRGEPDEHREVQDVRPPLPSEDGVAHELDA